MFKIFLDKIHKNPRYLRNYIKLNVTEQVSKIAIFAKKCQKSPFFVQKSKKFYGFIFFYAKNSKFQKKNKNFMDLWTNY